MIDRFLGVSFLLLTVFSASISSGQTGTSNPPGAAELALQGKTTEAVRLARKSPSGAVDALRSLYDTADVQITERQFKEAQATLTAAEKFLTAYSKVDKRKELLPGDALKGRNLRLKGIMLTEQKEFESALVVLKDALEISKQSKDPTLEARIHNNLGFPLSSQGKSEDSIKEFTLARDIAESQKDSLRAGSYNFNLGLALYQMKKWEPALDAFKRSAEQNHAAAKPILEAHATVYQGRALSNISSVSPEPMKYFVKAQKMYEKLGDKRKSAWCFYLMGDHTAYSMDFTRAAYYGEQALAGYTAVGDKDWQRRCYEFLADIYVKNGKKDKAEELKKKAQQISQSKG